MRDVISIGDVHGDGDRLLYALKRLRIADGPNWTGGPVSLVVIGDVLDGKERTYDTYRSSMGDIETVRYLHELRNAARRFGGDVTCLLGNHEIMNLKGDYSYVHDRDITGRAKAIRSIQPILQSWKRAHVENNTLFCHAGVSMEAAPHIRSVDDLNRLSDWHILENRQYAADTQPAPQEQRTLEAMLGRLGCARMVIGHNSVPKPVATWSGRVVLSDACLSRAYGNSEWIHVLCVRPQIGFRPSKWETISIGGPAFPHAP